MIAAGVAEFQTGFGYGVALVGDVNEELGRGGDDGDDVEDLGGA